MLLEQIELIKKGEFPDWLITAIINDLKLDEIKQYESNGSRAMSFVQSFILGVPWNVEVNKWEMLEKITKQDIIDFANENFKNNYVVVYKKSGKDKNYKKIKKINDRCRKETNRRQKFMLERWKK